MIMRSVATIFFIGLSAVMPTPDAASDLSLVAPVVTWITSAAPTRGAGLSTVKRFLAGRRYVRHRYQWSP